MDNNLKEAKKNYEEIEIPNTLNDIIEESIYKVRNDNNKNLIYNIKKVTAASILVMLCFVTLVNTSDSFAAKMSEVPIISELTKLVSFTSYKVENNVYEADVNIPGIKGIKSKSLEKEINEEIKERMLERLNESKIRAAEYKEAYLETGGKKENYLPIKIKIDYELKYQTENKMSFIIFQYESLASAYYKAYYYTIDLENNKLLSLSDLLGENYKNEINEEIYNQINKRIKENNEVFFDGDSGFNGITDEQEFYLNDNGNVVIVFKKYEIAPGSSGELEFIIKEK